MHSCKVHGKCTIVRQVMDSGVVCCATCPDYKMPPQPVPGSVAQIEVSANGIGDHLLGLTIAAAWKRDHPEQRLVYIVRHRQWVELFDGYDELANASLPGVPHVHEELVQRGGRHFVEVAATIPNRMVPSLRPLPADAVVWAEQFRRCVVLAPLSLGSGQGRNWLLANWIYLERLLSERGIPCAVVCAGDEGQRLSGFRSRVIAGEPAARVAALMKVATAVVSNESGMAHLAGALRVPCVVLAAQLSGKDIHGIWPHTTVLQGPLSCSGCRWTGMHFRDACHHVCASLQSITPEVVMDALERHIGKKNSPLLSDPIAERELSHHLESLCVPLPSSHRGAGTVADRRATMWLFLQRLLVEVAPLVVETGCQRADLDYGAGMSTTIFGLFLQHHGGRLVSLDNSPEHVDFCWKRVASYPVEVVLTDSRDWLRSYTGSPIHGLYLDSLDTWEPGHEDCCLEEAMLASSHLASQAIILIDDTWRQEGIWVGKGARAIPWLLSQRWRIVCETHQVLLERGHA